METLPNTLIALLGAVLVLTAVIGGGFEVKELKIPKVGVGAGFGRNDGGHPNCNWCRYVHR